jgi:hypothetical protein
MKHYVIVTGVLFLLLLIAHIWRATLETHLMRDPFFIFTTVISAILAVWAFRLWTALRRAPA